jgi:Uncharacterized alpha/beta hydrolase domain (DUF2235)
VKSAIVFSLTIEGSGAFGCRICGRSGSSGSAVVLDLDGSLVRREAGRRVMASDVDCVLSGVWICTVAHPTVLLAFADCTHLPQQGDRPSPVRPDRWSSFCGHRHRNNSVGETNPGRPSFVPSGMQAINGARLGRSGRLAFGFRLDRCDTGVLGWGGTEQPVHAPTPGVPRLVQLWFAGNHSDIGGSYPEPESRSGSKTAATAP